MAILEPDLPTLRYQLIKQANQTLHAPVLYKTQVKDQPPKSKTVCEIHEKKRKRKRERGKKKKKPGLSTSVRMQWLPTGQGQADGNE